MTKLTDLPNEIILQIFRDTDGPKVYMPEFWSLAYLDTRFHTLCLEENARVWTQANPDHRALEIQAEKMACWTQNEATYIATHFGERAACRSFRKPAWLIRRELPQICQQSEGIQRQNESLKLAARIIADTPLSRRHIALQPGELCCELGGGFLSSLWHQYAGAKLAIMRKKVQFWWWWAERKVASKQFYTDNKAKLVLLGQLSAPLITGFILGQLTARRSIAR